MINKKWNGIELEHNNNYTKTAAAALIRLKLTTKDKIDVKLQYILYSIQCWFG